MKMPKKKKNSPDKSLKLVQGVYYNRHEHRTETEFFNSKADALLHAVMNDLFTITITEEI